MEPLLKRIVPGLRGRRVHARLMIEPPKPVSEGWLLRVRCQNPGPPGAFTVEVVAVEGTNDALPALPWELLWRGQETAAPVELATRSGELARLALFRPAEPSAFVLLGASPTGELRQPVTGADGITLTIRVRRGSRVDAEKRVHVSSRQNGESPFVPIVTFST